MKLMGIAFYENGKYVKFIPVDENGKMDGSFTIFGEDEGIQRTEALVMYSHDEPTICKPGTTIQWTGIPQRKGLLQ